MLLIAVLAFVGCVAADSSSSSSTVCVPSVETPLPYSIATVISSISYYYPSVISIGSAISTLELSTPTLYAAEEIIEYYAQSYSTLIDTIESMYSYPSLFTSLTYVEEVTVAYSSLAQAISEVESAEETESELAQYQSTIQSVESYYTSFLTDMTLYTGFEYSTIYSDSYVISEATLTDSEIFPEVISIITLVSSSPTVSSALASLSSSLYTLPYTVYEDLISWAYSPSTVGSSTVSSLYECNSAAYYEMQLIESWEAAHQYYSLDTELPPLFSAFYYVSSLTSAVSYIVTYQMPTLTYDVSVVSDAASTQPSISVDISYFDDLAAVSSSLSTAITAIETTFYNSPTVASTIFYALEYPSEVTQPSLVSYYEMSHESFVTAAETLLDFESDFTSSSSTVEEIVSQLTTAFENYGSLITAYDYVDDVVSPSTVGPTYSWGCVESSNYDIYYIASSIVSLFPEYIPYSGSCYESTIEYYADYYPTVAEYLWSVLDDETYLASSSVSSFASLTASYSTLWSDMEFFGSYIPYYPSLASLESGLIYAASTDSTLLTAYEDISSASSSGYVYWSDYSPISYTVC